MKRPNERMLPGCVRELTPVRAAKVATLLERASRSGYTVTLAEQCNGQLRVSVEVDPAHGGTAHTVIP